VLGDPDRTNYDPGLVPTSKITVKSLTFTPVWDLPWATLKLIAALRKNENAGNRIDIDASPSKIVDSLQSNSNTQQSYELQVTGSCSTIDCTGRRAPCTSTNRGKDEGFTPALTRLMPSA